LNSNSRFLTPVHAQVTGGGQFANKFNVTLKEADFVDPQNIQPGELFSLDGCDCGYGKFRICSSKCIFFESLPFLPVLPDTLMRNKT